MPGLARVCPIELVCDSCQDRLRRARHTTVQLPTQRRSPFPQSAQHVTRNLSLIHISEPTRLALI
eukprot:5496131-Alexandrium_andersonii.AAC.1